jgi:hypothetical protein
MVTPIYAIVLEDSFHFPFLGRPLRKLHPQDEMSIAESIHLIACNRSIRPINKRDESETLGPAGVSVFGQEDSGHAAKALEHVA